MLYTLLSRQAVPQLFVPLVVESLLLVACVVYIGGAALVAPRLLRGSWPEHMARPTREVTVHTLLKFLYASAPLLGLFGTVVGMTLSFESIGIGSGADLGAALSTQLYTTLYGLAIAIPSGALLSLVPWRYDGLVEGGVEDSGGGSDG